MNSFYFISNGEDPNPSSRLFHLSHLESSNCLRQGVFIQNKVWTIMGENSKKLLKWKGFQLTNIVKISFIL